MDTELGERFRKVHGQSNVFARVRASQKTWAHHAKHFYSVVGRGKAELKVLANQKYCTNLTDAYLHQTSRLLYPRTEQAFSCNGIRVLFLPECKDGGFGAEGPCCRCQGAMRYYLNIAAVDPEYPPWFMFSDDDYYTRLHRYVLLWNNVLIYTRTLMCRRIFINLKALVYRLKGILDQVNPNKPYSVTGPSKSVAAGNHTVARQGEYGMDHWFGKANHNCSVPCTHHVGWLGYAILSYGTMRVMEEEVRADGLQQLCKLWKSTHDVGLGIFVWEHAIQNLPICCGSGDINEISLEDYTYYHHVAKTTANAGNVWSYNYLMHRIWELGAEARGETEPNWKTFVEWEYEQGRKAFVKPYPNGGFENSLYFRKVEFSEMIAKQMSEEQLVAYQGRLPLRRTSYDWNDCGKEMAFHIKWRKEHAAEFPLDDSGQTDETDWDKVNRGKVSNFPKMCMPYSSGVRRCGR